MFVELVAGHCSLIKEHLLLQLSHDFACIIYGRYQRINVEIFLNIMKIEIDKRRRILKITKNLDAKIFFRIC